MGQAEATQQTYHRKKGKSVYDITIMQTPKIGDIKGYKVVHRLEVEASSHSEAIYEVYRIFNVRDLMPKNTKARFIRTGDVLFFDEGLGGKTYYQLQTEGWIKIGRVHVR
ncbi:hypothetical protein ACFSCX_11400 [Bacillus salitolerans]|uniref:Uncharacterized protein n=1 Tax=Bacillus salitolerans TaxID=1437434 RepID=A0ABW4LRS1_9BACI